MDTQTNNVAVMAETMTSADVAKLAASEAAKVESTTAYKTAVKVINTDLKNAANTSEGIFLVIQQCQNWQEADSTFRLAENNLIAKYRETDPTIRTMADLCRASGVTQLSYTSIKNTLIGAVKEADVWCANLQKLYDFQYDGKSKEDQAKDGKETVPDGFLNPWHSRYQKRVADDEKPVTVFHRDRRLAQGALKALDQAEKLQAKARKEAEQRANDRLAESLRGASATADNAPAGSGGTAQGFSGGHRSAASTLSMVLQGAMNQFINAVHSASTLLADSDVLPIIGNATDKLVALVEAEKEAERVKVATMSASHDNPVRPVALGIEESDEQTTLEPGEVQIAAEDLPDVPADDQLDDTDKAILEEFSQQESGNNAVAGE